MLAYVSLGQFMLAYISLGQFMSVYVSLCQPRSVYVSPCQPHVSLYVLILSDQMVMVTFFQDIHIRFRLDKLARGLTQPLYQFV